MRDAAPTVFLVDDDPSVQKALARLLTSVGLRVQVFGSPQELLSQSLPRTPGCLVLDVRLPGVSGLELQRLLSHSGVDFPIIFITGHGDISMSVRAMKAGAIDFLTKPVNEQELLDAVQQAIERHTAALSEQGAEQEIRQRIATLTHREEQVLALVVRGMINKQIARELGVAEKTIKVHRGRMMEKMQAESLAELFRMAAQVGIAVAERPADSA
jgi:FixJ family two-component response regulator